jgi:hypothetical protein
VKVRLAARRERRAGRESVRAQRPPKADRGARPARSNERGVVRAAGAPFFGTFFGRAKKVQTLSHRKERRERRAGNG